MSRRSELLSADSESILSAALEGLELQKQRIDVQIAQIRAALGKGMKVTASPTRASSAASSGKRNLSEAARKRIAAAQKKRWAEYRKQKDGNA